jgi:hypothetical protein
VQHDESNKEGEQLMTNYLKAYKNKGRIYWWLVEAKRNGHKVVQKKLKYFGIHKPSERYSKFLMSRDDDKPLDDLWIVWQADSHWKTRRCGGFEYYLRNGNEENFWRLTFRAALILAHAGIEEVWFTRAVNRREAIKNAKKKLGIDLVVELVTLKLDDDRLYHLSNKGL